MERMVNANGYGIGVPLAQINSYNYTIKLAGQDEPFDDQWKHLKVSKIRESQTIMILIWEA